MTTLLCVLALLPLATPLRPGAEIFVRTDASVPIERLAQAVRPIGRIESREPGTRIFLIELRPGLDDHASKERLAKCLGVHALTPQEEPVDARSIKSLTRKIAHMACDEAADRAKGIGKGKTSERERDEVDYLKAYKYFVSRRAFPNDTVDWSAYPRARAHIATMQPTVLRGRQTGPIPDTTPQIWTFLGPTNMHVPYRQYYGQSPISGRINAVAYDPNNAQTIYAGGAQGGLWKSTNGGNTWAWLSGGWTELAVNCIVIDPTDSDTIYVGRGDYHGMIVGSYGIMKSTDGGNTWTEVAEATMGLVGVDHILMDPTNSQTLIAGTGDAATFGRLYRSVNGGQTWTLLPAGGSDFEWPTMAAGVPSNGKVRFYAVAAGYAKTTAEPSRVYKSDDHGLTWQLLASKVAVNGAFHYAYEVATSPTNPNNVYVLDSENKMLFTSTNQGATWKNMSSNLPLASDDYNFSQDFYDYHLECGTYSDGANSSDLLFLGEIDLTESRDGGNTWTSVGGPTYAVTGALTHNDQHCLAVCPSNPNQCLFSNDGGIYALTLSADSTAHTITPLNQLMAATTFYKLSMHPTLPNVMLGGTQDNASPVSLGDLSNWITVGGGDGGGCAINQANPLVQYASAEGLVIYQTPDAWTTENVISPSPNPNENLPFVAAMTLDPSSPNVMYTATNYLYRLNATFEIWNERLGGQDLTNDTKGLDPTVDAIAVAPTDSNRIYTGSSDGALWMTTNLGQTWVHLNPKGSTLPNEPITSISVSPSNENDILVGLSGAGHKTAHLSRCTNAATKAPVFVNATGSGSTGLPDVSLNAIARDLDNPASTWWVAMDSGVFQTTNAGATWTNAGAPLGLPNVIVDDLAAVPATRYLNAATYGRGVWSLYLPPSAQVSSLTNLSVNPSAITATESATGTVTLSSAAPAGGIAVALSSSDSMVASTSASVVIAAGSSSATFDLTAGAGTSAIGTCIISAAYGGVTFTQDVSVTPLALATLAISPAAVLGGSAANGTVTLNAAPGEPVAVSLTSSGKSATVAASVLIPAGSTTASFAIQTASVASAASATITAKLGTAAKSTSLSIKPDFVQDLALSAISVIGGSNSLVTGTITLAAAAPATGATVSISSSNVRAATVPASVKLAGGAHTATFAVSDLSVTAAETATVKATYGGESHTALLTVLPVGVSSLTLSPSSVAGGTACTGAVTLSAAAGAKGYLVSLKSNSLSATVPATVKVPAGASSVTFKVTTKVVKAAITATITAEIGSGSRPASVTILP